MQRQQIRETLKGILDDETDSQLGDLPDELVLIDAFDLDSVERVSLMMRVEEQFHIRMTNDELSWIGTIGSLIDFSASKGCRTFYKANRAPCCMTHH
jgi:acyl carrier protein